MCTHIHRFVACLYVYTYVCAFSTVLVLSSVVQYLVWAYVIVSIHHMLHSYTCVYIHIYIWCVYHASYNIICRGMCIQNKGTSFCTGFNGVGVCLC